MFSFIIEMNIFLVYAGVYDKLNMVQGELCNHELDY